jgi:AAA domain/Bifunctional DNA primase/polymerase, N-terminal/Primase C terminal 2 (PriCT-2)
MSYTETVANATNFFEFAERHGLALFPIQRGQKLPHGIVASFAHDWAKSPEQWVAWRNSHNCNFGIVAFASRLVIVDIDVSEIGPDAWNHWTDWCVTRGLPVYQPYCTSARGGWHVAFSLPPEIDVESLRQVPLIGPIEGVSKKAVIDLRIKGYVVAPGSYYDGTARGEESGHYKLLPNAQVHPAPAALLAACARKPRVSGTTRAGTADPNDTAKVLEWMADHDCFASYDQWREVGMILRSEFGDDPGFALWQITNDGTCSAESEAAKWESFAADPRSDGVGIGTLIHNANKAGCPHHIRKSTQAMFQGVAAISATAGATLLPPLPYAPSPSLAPAVPPIRLIQSSREFIANFVAPSFLIDGVIQKQNVYALTAAPGTGKTAIALRISAHVALGRKLGDRDVERGRVLYFAAENYVDVQARLIAMAEHCGFDVNTIEIYFVAGTSKLSEIADRVTAEAEALGDLTLVIVDTSAATFEGSDENSNVDGLVHAKRMRSLTELRGKPTVLVLCHPVKSATTDNLLPRGGSSFFGEIDGNLCARKNDSAVELHWFGKIRGMDFAPIAFRVDTVVADSLKDARGRKMPSVLATPIDDASKQVMAATERSDQDCVLRAISDQPGESSNEIAKRLGWAMRDGKPYGVRVRRAAERMAGDGLLMKHRGEWILSARGEKELNKLDRKIAVPTGTSAVPVVLPFPLRNAH